MLNKHSLFQIFYRKTGQGLQELGSGKNVIVIDYWDSSDKIKKTIHDAVEKHKKKNKKQESR